MFAAPVGCCQIELWLAGQKMSICQDMAQTATYLMYGIALALTSRLRLTGHPEAAPT